MYVCVAKVVSQYKAELFGMLLGSHSDQFATTGTTLPPPPPAWCRAQKVLLQRTTGKSCIGELAPMALCDIHVAGGLW